MTIGECLINWLNRYEELDMDNISTDILNADDGSYAISKSPNETVDASYNDGTKLKTRYYNLLARRSSSLDEERISNEQLLENLEVWIDNKQFNEDLPDLSEANAQCTSVSIINTSTITSIEDDSIIYQVSIGIQFIR